MSVWENLKHLKGLNVVNLFAGMEVGRLACERAGVPIDKYYSSEIDKYAIQVSKANWPDIIHLGDVTKVYGCTLPDIHLLLGGSPCQGFSFAGKQLNFNDPRSALLFEYVRILKELREFNPNIYFLLENVMMKKEYQDVISELLGVQPVMINSALVSAQNRKRLYWTNIPFLGQPVDKGIVLKDILETSGTGFVINRSERSEKAMCIDANYHKGADNHGQRTLISQISSETNRDFDISFHENGNVRPHKLDARKSGISEIGTIVHPDNKCVTHIASHVPNVLELSEYSDRCQKQMIQVGLATDLRGHEIQRRIYSDEGKAPTLLAQSAGGAIPPKIALLDLEAYSDICKNQIRKNTRTEDQKGHTLSTNSSPTAIGVTVIKQLNPSTESGGKQPYMQNRVFDPEYKGPALTASKSDHYNVATQYPASIVGRRLNEDGIRDDYNKNVPITQCLQVKHNPDKTGCLTTVDKDNAITEMLPGRYEDVYSNPGFTYRKLTVTECERLQTVPDGYTQRLSATAKQISNTQAYKMLGNGWTTDVIAHLLSPLGDYRFLY